MSEHEPDHEPSTPPDPAPPVDEAEAVPAVASEAAVEPEAATRAAEPAPESAGRDAAEPDSADPALADAVASEPTPTRQATPEPAPLAERLPDAASDQPTPESAPVAEAMPDSAAEEPTADPAAAASKPTPSPGPAPATPAPAPVPAPEAPATVVPPPSDPAPWGRVADDGTVYVKTADGERPVGSYPGATPEEALAYFGRKFDELQGQVTLLEQRVVSGKANLGDAAASVASLREAIAEAHAVGDLAGLAARLDQLTIAIGQRRERRDAERAKARQKAAAQKERIVAEAESLATSTEWKKTGDRLRALLDEWKAAARLDRKTDDALWKRFSAARTAFDKHRRTHFAQLDEQRSEATAHKEKLVKQAEALAESKEWKETARAFRDLMTEWKAAGRAKRDADDALWTRFKAAQDTFFAARNEVFSARDADNAENLAKKRALLVEAEALLPVTDPKSARRALRSIHDRWEDVGHVPRGDKDEVEGRLRKVDEAVRDAEQAAWKRSNPEARARAEDTVNQLRKSIAALEKDAADARAAGNEKKAAEAEEAARTRTTWLVEAEKTLLEFS